MVLDLVSRASPLQEFYHGVSVLVVGVSNHTGRHLVVKLVNTCPGLSRIYLLFDCRDGWDKEQHLASFLDLCASEDTNNSARTRQELNSKIVPVVGDVATPCLGLSERDRRLLNENVGVVFHVVTAANRDEQLKVNFLCNVRGTRGVLDLCHKIQNLKSVVHVSTAFIDFPPGSVEETFYDSPISSEQAVDMAVWFEPDQLSTVTSQLQGEYPDTNSFLSVISEHAVKVYGRGLPVAVVRPPAGSLEVITGKEGHSGDNVTPRMSTSPTDASRDNTVNCLIAAAWSVAENSHKGPLSHIPIYNCILTQTNLITSLHDESSERKCNKFQEVPPPRPPTSRVLSQPFVRAVLHVLAALLADIALLASSLKVKMSMEFHKTIIIDDALRSSHKDSSSSMISNIDHLSNMLTPSDRKLLNFDLQAKGLSHDPARDWTEQTVRGILGVCGLDRINRLFWVYRSSQCLSVCLSAWVCWISLTTVFLRTTNSIVMPATPGISV